MYKESTMKSLMLIPMTLATLTATERAHAPATHQTTVTGALTANLAGKAVFGPVRGTGDLPASFSLELGTYSDKGSVVFSRVSTQRPKTGVYEISTFETPTDGADDFHALISLGSVEHPLGVFRAMSGTVTISHSSEDRIVGEYEVHAVGFLAADADNEDREITVRGGFSAEPSISASRFEATVRGAVQSPTRGLAEFGDIGPSDDRHFSLTMGAYSEQGAVLLSRAGAGRPAAGVYRLREAVRESGAFHGLVITGSPSNPTGVFRVQRGTMTITTSTTARISGTFELRAVGFLASDVSREDREVTMTGSFTATPSGQDVTLTLK
jgi:hypothetical protein